MESKIQNIISINKELILKHEALESLVIGITENSPKNQEKNNAQKSIKKITFPSNESMR